MLLSSGGRSFSSKLVSFPHATYSSNDVFEITNYICSNLKATVVAARVAVSLFVQALDRL